MLRNHDLSLVPSCKILVSQVVCGREANRIAVVSFRLVVLLVFFSLIIQVVSNVTSVCGGRGVLSENVV